MEHNVLPGAYFRQQAELGMPALVINPAIMAPFSAPVKSPAPVKITPSQTPKAAPEKLQPPRLTPAMPPQTKPEVTMKSRLASLRPVESLVATAPKKPQSVVSVPSGRAPVALANRRDALKQLFISGCSKCHLVETRTKFVFGSGNAEAPVMVIGEAPGQEEDEQGLPFVGAAGKLLTTMLAAINLDRNSDVFITNVLKCHPPENRSPESSEIITCLPLLREQIDIIQPKALLLLGRIAAHSLLDINDSIAKMRSRVFDYHGISTMVIYHPAALLRNAEYKRPAWEDLKQFQQLLATSGIYGSLRKE